MEIIRIEGAFEKSTIDKERVATLSLELRSKIIGFLVCLKGVKRIQVGPSGQEFILEFSSLEAGFDFLRSGNIRELCRMVQFLEEHVS